MNAGPPESTRTPLTYPGATALVTHGAGGPGTLLVQISVGPIMEAALGSGLEEFRSFVNGLRRDETAVRMALRLAWNNGATEGHIHRLKMSKRSMYRRANFDLLWQRVLQVA